MGQIKSNKRHGKGVCLLQDGSFYEGFWKDDIPYGYGRIIKTNGSFYEGMCYNFKVFILLNFVN